LKEKIVASNKLESDDEDGVLKLRIFSLFHLVQKVLQGAI
jgi:hypothetical protein